MMFAFGVVLFALGIAFSIALHEYGHLAFAKAFGMKVRRYYIGFGPKLFSFRRGETEYGLKAIPAGGFCDIAGMTALDELAPDEVDRAMYKQATWKRIMVMMGGPISHFVLGYLLIVLLAVGWGLPNINATTDAVVGQTVCVAPSQAAPERDAGGALVAGELAPCDGVGPAQAAGVRAGDVITAVDGQPMASFAEVVRAVQAAAGAVTLTVERDGQALDIVIPVERAQRWVLRPGQSEPESAAVGAIGVTQGSYGLEQHNLLSALPASAAFTGDMAVKTWQALLDFPERLPAVARAIMGEERDPDSPISVVGASRLGGEVAEQGWWEVFVLLLASLNFFIGLFNLLPILPLDGGHMAVTLYERLRNWLRNLRGLPNGPPVDYNKLLPLTYVFVIIGGGIMLLTITADIVNPITLR